MALSPINPTQLTPPRVALIDERSGAISREWYRFFLSLLTATETNQAETELLPDTSSLLASYDAMLADLAQTTETQPEGASVSALAIAQSDIQSLALAPPGSIGSVTSVDASGGTTGLIFSGGPITTSGTLTLSGTLAVANGGTGQTSYTNGQLLIGNTTGNTLTKATLTAGTNITLTNGAGAITINATDAFVGTVTSVSVVSANGFAGTVATATTTPAITLSTSINGIIKGNGTALSAAVAATDYVAPSAYASANGLTMTTARLLGRTTASTGAAEEITVGTGLLLSAGTLSSTVAGTVTSVSGTGTVNGITLTGTVTTSGSLTLGGTLSGVSLTTQVSGTLPVANGGTGQTTYTNGQLLIGNTTGNTLTKATLTAGTNVSITNGSGAITINATDAFVGTVTSVSGTGTVNGITLTGTVTSSGSLTLGGTLSGVSLTTQVSGTLPVANGGTNASTFTAGSVVFAGTSGTYTQNNAGFFWDNTNSRLGISTTTPNAKIEANGDILTTWAAASIKFIGSQFSTSFDLGMYMDSDNRTLTLSAKAADGLGTIVFKTGVTPTERARIDNNGNMGVGTTANASAILDVQSTTKGFRLPNMTTVQKNAIATPAAGLMVFDTTLAKACVYSGAAWQTITSV